jgi:AraC-like DNA-binding protein
LDILYKRYEVTHPFRITAYRTLNEYRGPANTVFSGESHNFWEFICRLEGESETTRGNEIFHMRPGNLLAIPPMVFHSNRTTTPYHTLNFSFEITGTFPAIFSEGVFYLSPSEINELTGIFYRLQKAYFLGEPDPELGAEATSAMESFLMQLSRQHTPHNKHSNSRNSITYHKILKSMEDALYMNLSLQEIAMRNKISVSTIKALFQTFTGISPKKYYSDMRGIEALRLLEEGLEISQIAEKMNYSSVNYLSTTFKKQFGLPPGQFRSKITKQDTTDIL